MLYDIVIAGAGVVGGMLAREFSKYHLNVCVLEKENDVSCGASKANSGIIHGGYDPEPNTLKALLNVSGVPMLYQAAEELNVPYIQNGSMVVAFGTEQEPFLEELYERGIQNGVVGLKLISGEEARELEPNLSAEISKVLVVSGAGIICPYELTIAAVGNAMDNGVTLKRNFDITSISYDDNGFEVISKDDQTIKGKYIINCAGTGAEKIANMIGDNSFQIIPRAGEYMLLDKAEGTRVSHTIFQVPTDKGKGVLVTPTVHGNLLVGPTSEIVDSNFKNQTTQEGLSNVIELSAKSVSSIQYSSVITSFTGIRASEKNKDFIIRSSEITPKFIHVAAIDSPGLTCCVSIAKYAVNLLKNLGLHLEEKSNWNGHRDDPHFFKKMDNVQKDSFIKEHPSYGKIVCRCETVSEGEIVDAICRNPVAVDVDGVKRRMRSGMGRCQGGFCTPHIIKLLAKQNQLPLQQITKNGVGSELLTGKL